RSSGVTNPSSTRIWPSGLVFLIAASPGSARHGWGSGRSRVALLRVQAPELPSQLDGIHLPRGLLRGRAVRGPFRGPWPLGRLGPIGGGGPFGGRGTFGRRGPIGGGPGGRGGRSGRRAWPHPLGGPL